MEGSSVPDELPVYVPHSRVCHIEQYHCCKYRQHCRLYPVCSQIEIPTVCIRDCPSCSYSGCSLDAILRVQQPVYIGGVIQSDRLDLNIEGQYWKEHAAHKKRHANLWYFYNCLFGEHREKHRISSRKHYKDNLEKCRASARASAKRRYRKLHPNCGQRKPRKYNPPCGEDCGSCPYDDCILPENWRDKLYEAARLERDPDYYRRYYRANEPRIRAYRKQWYKDNRAEIRAKQKAYYQRPEIKAQFAERSKKYAASHREEIKAYKKAWYEKNKEAISAQKKEKKRQEKVINEQDNP